MDDTKVSPRIVGRDEELARIDRMMVDRDEPWLLFVKAPGGQGKSRLLETVLEKYRALGHPTSGLFDFFTDGHRTQDGVLSALAGRFGLRNNSAFYRHLRRYRQATADRDAAVQNKALADMESALVRALSARFRSRRGLIVVDTVEQISRLKLSDWFFGKFLPRLTPNVVVLAGGREVPERAVQKLKESQDVAEAVREGCQTLELEGLSLEAVKQYLEQVLDGFVDDPEAAVVTRRVHQLTSGPGQALLMALVAVGLNGGDSAIPLITPDELKAWTTEELHRHLVDDPFRDTTPQGKVLMRLAHFYHGLDTDMLAQIDAAGTLGTVNYDDLLRQLHDRPYVKYHPDARVVRLHDYFADRAQKLLAAGEDPSMSVRRDWSLSLVPYLEEQVRRAGGELSPRADRLRQQWLYHLLFADTERAYGELWEALDQAWHARRYDYMDVLLAMARDVNDNWQRVNRFDPLFDRLAKAAKAWMWLNDVDMPRSEVVRLADEVIEGEKDGVRRLYLTATAVKGAALGFSGSYDAGIECLNDAFKGYEKLLKDAEAAEAGDATAQRQLVSEHGLATAHGIRPERYLVKNYIGFVERKRGKYEAARRAFNEGFELVQAEGETLRVSAASAGDQRLARQVRDAQAFEALLAMQIGDTLGYLGDAEQALRWTHRSLALRRELELAGPIADTLAVLGKLKREDNELAEARIAFKDALEIWQELDSLANVQFAKIQLGHIETLDGLFARADDYFEAAADVCVKKNYYTMLTDLRLKQAQNKIARARQETNEAKRRRLLEDAEQRLYEARRLAEQTSQPLYDAISLAELARADEMRNRFDRIPEWRDRLYTYTIEHEFGPAFASMERVLGDVALRQARREEDGYAPDGFDEAVGHYLQMYLYLARHYTYGYRRRFKFLNEWLPSLPEPWRRRAGERLIADWRVLPLVDPKSEPEDPTTTQPGTLAEKYADFIELVRFHCL